MAYLKPVGDPIVEKKRVTPDDFAYWLQGYFEVSQAKTLNKEEAKAIKEKLQAVFIKKTSVDGSGHIPDGFVGGSSQLTLSPVLIDSDAVFC